MIFGIDSSCRLAIGRLIITAGLALAAASQALGQLNWTSWKNGQSIGSFYGVAGTATETVSVGAMGSNGRIATRNNSTGIWVIQDFAPSPWFRDVIYANNQYVTVREGGSIMTSPDGLTWTNQVSPTTNHLRTLLWDGHQYIAAGQSGTILTSPDGVTWTSRSSGTTTVFNSLSYSGSRYIAVGGFGVRVSTDGISWSAPTTALPSISFEAATWTGTQFIIGGLGGSSTPTLYGSPDGLTWTLLNSAFKENVESIVAVGGRTFIAGTVNGTGNGFVYQTLDGVTLTNTYLSPNGSEYFMAIAYNGEKLIAAGFNHNVWAATFSATEFSPVFTTQPGNQSVTVGLNAGFSVAAVGFPTPTFQWQSSADSGSTWLNLAESTPYSGTTTNSLSLTPAPVALNGYRYRCAATNNAGTTISNAVSLSIEQPAPAEWVLIPAGTFTMGDSLDGDANSLPTHQVTLPSFYLAKTETTWAEWVAVRDWAVTHGYTDLAAIGSGKAGSHPVNTVSWYDVVKWLNAKSEKDGFAPSYYTNDTQTTVYRTGTVSVTNAQVKWDANGYRLPTEAEWEYASRGGMVDKRFPWGDTITHLQSNYSSSATYSYDVSATRGSNPTYATGGQPYTSPVGSFAANGFGLYDMAGNECEWCWDRTGSYTSGAVTSPVGPTTGSSRVTRGGGWQSSATWARSATRYQPVATTRIDNIGFRAACSDLRIAPAITNQPANLSVIVGQPATLTAAATGSPPPTYQWRKNGAAITGATTSSFNISSATIGDSGRYTVLISNSEGSVTSNPADLVVNVAAPPAISTAPANMTIVSNDRAQLRVTATGTAPLSYQWFQGAGGDATLLVSGATSATFTTPTLTTTTSYWVRITDANSNVTNSPAATITVSATSPLTVSQSIMGHGYMAGGAVTVTNTITYTGTAPSLIDWATLLPVGWKYVASGGSEGAVRPQFNAPDLLEWSWTTVPASPITFVYTVSVPAGTTADQVIASLVTSQQSGASYQTMAKPDPLVLRTASLHSADTNADGRISLFELTRVIELYNYRSGTVRTGQFKVKAGTEDGFEPGP